MKTAKKTLAQSNGEAVKDLEVTHESNGTENNSDEEASNEGDSDSKAGSNIISRLIAYESIRDGATAICEAINAFNQQTNKILIVDDLDQATTDVSLIQVETTFKKFQSRFDAIERKIDALTKTLALDEADAGSSSLIEGIVGIVPDLINAIGSFFKRQYTISNDEFDIPLNALKYAVASRLNSPFTRILNFNLITKSEIFETFSHLLSQQTQIDAKCEAAKSSIPDPEEDTGKSPKAKYPVCIAEWETLSKLFGKYIETITAGKAKSTLAQAAIRSQIRAMNVTHLLHLSILTSGGFTMKESKFREKGNLDFFGGSALAYALADTHGSILSSDIFTPLSTLDYSRSSDAAEYHQISVKNLSEPEPGKKRGLRKRLFG